MIYLSRREGLMPADTRELILNTAERLFAEHGFAGTSLRRLTAAAGVNLAAVNYYFGSKAALFQTVIRRRGQSCQAEQLRLLEECEAQEQPPSVEALLTALLSPIFALIDRDDERGPVLGKLMVRIAGDPSEAVQRLFSEEVQEIHGRYLRAFRRALPDVAPDELWWRFRSIDWLLAWSHQASTLAHQWPGAPLLPDRATQRTWMITFLAAALRAPATAPHGSARGEPGRPSAQPGNQDGHSSPDRNQGLSGSVL
jgi:AcrR family transcriptional regulator